MLIGGLDIATNCGVAFYNTERPEAAIIARTVKAEGDSSEGKAWDAASKFIKLIKANGTPDFWCVEQAFKQAPKGKSIHSVVEANVLAGCYTGIIGAYRTPMQTITPATWRKAMFGFSRKPGMDSKAWKRLAREHCQMMKVDVNNADEAESVLLAIYGARCSGFAQKLKYEQAVA